MSDGYHITPFPRERELVLDAGRLGSRRHMIQGLLELDVTRPRQMINQHKERTGETLSFTAYIVACLGKAIQEHPALQSYRDWLGRLVWFDDVDVVTLIETSVDKVALPHIIRGAQRKTFRQIHDEIRAVQSQPRRSPQKNPLMQLGPYLPFFVRRMFYWIMCKNPVWLKQVSGTVIVTSVGMFGKGGGSGWGITFVPWHTLGLVVGGIAQKPGVVDGRIEIREYLYLTVNIDHDVVDGAPATRFARSLTEWIIEGKLLEGEINNH